MTGKEALNLLFCTSEGLPEDKVYECKKTLGKELEELTKYKMAFEILKRELDIRCSDGEVWFFKCIGETDISKEEYELLEELMKDE